MKGKSLLVSVGALLASTCVVAAELPGSYSGMEGSGSGSGIGLFVAIGTLVVLVALASLWDSYTAGVSLRKHQEVDRKKTFYYDNGKRVN